MLAVAAMAVAMTGSLATAAHAAPSTSELTKKIEAASNQLEDITENYNKMNISLKKTIADEKKLAASLAPAQAALKAASARVGTLAATSYMQGRVGPMTALLSGEGQDDLVDKINYLDQISRANQRDIDSFTEATQNFSARQAALKATQAKQTAQVNALAARKAGIQKDIKKLMAMRTEAYGQAQETTSKYTGTIPTIAGSAGKAVTFAYNQLGEAYEFGADGPSTWDCSGLTSGAWAAAGKSLPHNTEAQWGAVAHISRSQLQPGDLVFYRSLGHVAIYVGDGMIIHAPHTGTVVKKVSVDVMSPYGYGRVK
ncbi:Cell wall-associated hydrolase, NlpC family [Paractinoplanes atraurantiacus]|uniref:Cell wall-associated hydrolase, NlpC family n=2 Tax=Paractinoplanes atraurantiacus TaxID=1036182 RepID=A0A285H511_9ACTN|nr:Cell wall-associated hydrolase, NlpC family [Actinoplanes atraurantiacus]